jgi:hypothetical protein
MEEGMEPISEELAKELSDASLAEELASYQKAMDEEFAPGELEGARERIKGLVPDAELTLEELVKHANSESVRLSAAKFIFTAYYGKSLGEGNTDPIDRLMDKLTRDE